MCLWYYTCLLLWSWAEHSSQMCTISCTMHQVSANYLHIFTFVYFCSIFGWFACILKWALCSLVFDIEFIKQQDLVDVLCRKYVFRIWLQKTSVFQFYLLEEISSFILTSLNVKVSVFFCSNGRCDPSQQGFGSVLLKALLDNMPLLPAAATGGTYGVFVV